jgi:uncharacterized protein (DUF952 family)
VPVIYKVCSAGTWQEARRAGALRGTADDRRDGYIHLSTADQLAGTLAKHFSGQRDLVLLAVEAAAVSANLRWEQARGGALFPHLYGELPASAVAGVHPVRLGPDGRHVLPELVP